MTKSKQILELLRAGVPVADIVRQVGTTRQWVHWQAKRHGITPAVRPKPPKPPKAPDPKVVMRRTARSVRQAAIVSAYESGESLSAIAKRFGFSGVGSVNASLCRWRVPRRYGRATTPPDGTRPPQE